MFITLEGIDGCGKSTQVKLLQKLISDSGREVVTIREPGGTDVTEYLRPLIMSKSRPSFGAVGDALLYEISRVYDAETFISNALSQGIDVISDRYVDSLFAYNGTLVSIYKLLAIAEACYPLWPDVTIYIDITPAESRKRRLQRVIDSDNISNYKEDRIESRDDSFIEQVKANYDSFLTKDPLWGTRYPTVGMSMGSPVPRIYRVDGAQSIGKVTMDCYAIIENVRTILGK